MATHKNKKKYVFGCHIKTVKTYLPSRVSGMLAAKEAEVRSSVDRQILGHASWARRPDEITRRWRHDDGWGPSPDFHRVCGKTECLTDLQIDGKVCKRQKVSKLF